MRMKKFILFLVGLLSCVSCSDQLSEKEVTNIEPTTNVADGEYNYYLEKARWGDAEAFVKLADFYHSGQNVKSDFVGMVAMLTMAEQFGSNVRMEDYMKNLPDGDNYRILFETMDKVDSRNLEKAREAANQLIANGSADGHVLMGVIQIEEGDTLGGIETIRRAVEDGSSFGELILCLAPAVMDGQKRPDTEKMLAMAERYPYAYKFLADVYTGMEDADMKNETLAVQYYNKADEYGFLGQRGARWLMDYYVQNKIQIDEQERKRLLMLCRGHESDYQEEAIPVVHQEQELQDYVDSIARYRMLTDECNKAIVYVVETETGTLIAHTSLRNNGNSVVSYVDTYNKENDQILGAATYLALLWSGNVSPSTIIDTESGVYEDDKGNVVRDHNWRRGGYGEIPLEYALTHRSNIAFTKAIEQAYGKDMKAYYEQIDFYHNGNANSPIGILTFYNAIANGGRMMRINEPEDTTITVLHEQIAYPEYIRQVQEAMEHCVSDGLYRKAGNEYTDVAACGRSLRITDTTYRLELCGYFPAKNPKYTIMVIMEKDGLPASAGGMCGPLFSQIVVGLLPKI